MIVKNESAIISRALASARPWIDYWVICDTGSTDGTQDEITRTLEGIDGELHQCEWINFGHNRTEAVQLAAGKSDYILVMDADMTLTVSREFRHRLWADYYEIRYTGPLDYSQAMLFANRFSWHYVGVTHEYLHAEGTTQWDFLPEVSLSHFGDGGNRSDKYERDVRLLLEALQQEPDNTRNKFYLAQSYKDLGKWTEALEWYEQRIAATDGWAEETWYAMYQRAEMKRLLQHPWPEVLSAYQLAIDERPQRLEPLYAIVRHYRAAGAYQQGYYYSSFAIQGITYPEKEQLFVEKPVYDYLLLLEHIACALACGRVSETIRAVNLMFKIAELPQWVYEKGCEARGMALRLLYGPGKQISGESELEYNKSRIVVFVPFHNPGAFLEKCVQSLVVQDTTDFQVIFVDDASTDAAADFYPPESLSAQLIRNSERRGTAYNYHQVITRYCEPDDIVICLDGDDRLAVPNVISSVREHYQKYDCWVLYGQYRGDDGTLGISAPFSSPNDFLTLRQEWKTSHLRTFRAGLFQCIAEQDPGFSCLKDDKGQWLQAAVDAAVMFPLLEMAGFYRVHFNEQVWYIYVTGNPGSHHHANIDDQRHAFELVRQKRPFSKVSGYVPQLTDQYLLS